LLLTDIVVQSVVQEKVTASLGFSNSPTNPDGICPAFQPAELMLAPQCVWRPSWSVFSDGRHREVRTPNTAHPPK
jgi:hypothetical protein